MTRRQHNRIIVIQNQNGEWVKEHKYITAAINNYYNELFSSSLPNEESMEEFLEDSDYTIK